jgi:phenylacetate-coenzyme A ligase PaaK-like adenylate-forming protein
MPDFFTDKLFSIEDAFDFSDENKNLFLNSMKEMCEFHFENSDIFRGLCNQHNFKPSDLIKYEDVNKIPHIIVTAFKTHKIISVPETEISLTLTSSGTQGQKSQINLDESSFTRQAFMRSSIVKSQKLSSDSLVNYMVFSYSPNISGQKGAAHTFQKYTEFAPAKEKYFALQGNSETDVNFNANNSIDKLIKYSEMGLPLRVVGFLAFSYATFKEMQKLKIKLEFPAESLLLTGGGWKSHTGETVDFEKYAEIVNDVLGIAPDRIRDFYGMVEHGVPYMSCSNRHYHIPIYANVKAIDPGTLEILPNGETGILKLQTSYIKSTPAISVLSTDLGFIESNCKCGLQGDYIVLKGRAGVQKHAGCAISASQLIRL